MVVLVGYSVAGLCIVVVGRSRRMLGCLGNLVLCQFPATTVAGQATTRVRQSVCLGVLNRVVLHIFSDFVNCRSKLLC